MKCPVCKASIPPLQEHCDECFFVWKEGQEDCPAFLDLGGYYPCDLKFRHSEQKHRAMHVIMEDIEATILWHYPANSKFRDRSKDWEEKHGR